MTRVYQNNSWDGDESVSGRGSSRVNTKHIEKELPYLINNLNIGSILDIPCGDFAWMPRLLANLPDHIKYHGADIVEEIIENNQQYSNERVSFSSLDITSDELPYADLVFVRDCFNHLPFENIFQAFRNIKQSGAKYLVITHFNWKDQPNNDIKIGKRVNWRKLNYTLQPFLFNNPLDLIVEGSSEVGGRDKTLAIWKVSDINI